MIRAATVSEAAALTAIVNLAFRKERFFIDTDRITQEEVQRLFGTGTFLVAEEGDDIAGCIYIELRGERGYFGLLSVDPTRQGGGVGSRLIAAAEEYGLSHGCRFMDIQIVHLRAELPAYYGRRGYRETGTAPFPANVVTKVPCHFICMSKPLGE